MSRGPLGLRGLLDDAEARVAQLTEERDDARRTICLNRAAEARPEEQWTWSRADVARARGWSYLYPEGDQVKP